MATIVPPSHSRVPSISALDRDLNPSYSLPAQPGEPPQFAGYSFPPQYASSEPYAFPPRRSSVPPTTRALRSVISAPRPKSSHSDARKQLGVSPTLADPLAATGRPSPETADCVSPRSAPPPPPSTPHHPGRPGGDGSSSPLLSPGARLGPGMGAAHNRVASELLHIPMLEPNPAENESAPIQKKAPPPPGVNPRRGHAHRRSGAISSSDVWSLMNQSAPSLPLPSTDGSPKDGSPGDTESKDASEAGPGVSPLFSWSAPVSPGCNTASHSGADSDSKSGRRVSFIENVEVIPRPMSSGTESSSPKTVQGHSGVDNNASTSPVSSDGVETISSPNRRPHNRTRSNSQTLAQPTAALRAHSDRPSTAGAILASIQTTKFSETDIPPVPPLPANFLPPGNSSPARSPELSPGALSFPKKAHKKAKSDSSPSPISIEFRAEESPETLSECPSLSLRKQKKKHQRRGKKQIKTWAGSILGKGKHKHSKRQRKSKRAPTPPLARSESAAPGENEWVATSWNESYVLMPAETSPVLESPKRSVSGSTDRPLIDLDAALGPFMTPIETATGFAAARRKMHSAASRGNVGYFHRRSESMPEMQLFALKEDEDRPMEDVFEEDDEEEEEEEEEEDVSTSEDESTDDEEGQMNGGDGLGIGLRTDGETEWSASSNVDVSYTSADDKRLSNRTITPLTVSSTDFVGPTQESTEHPPSPRRKAAPADIITSAHSSTSTVTGSVTLEQPAPGLPLDSPSTFVTASSNLNTPNQPDFPDDTSNTFNPYRDYLGEPGPEMRLSSDDIPSLTSSSSTMTMSAVYSGMPSTPSVNDMVTPPTFSGEKPKKPKSKRWSRVWGFWKSK